MRNKSGKESILIAGAIIASAAASPAMAASHDAQTWLTGAADIQLDDRWALDIEINGRFTDVADRLGESQYKAVFTRQLSPSFSASAGLGRMIKHNAGAGDRNENRLWQAATWSPGEIAGVAVATRTQLEQKFISGDLGWRARQRISFKRPLNERTHLFATGEAYFTLNDTNYGARKGFEQLRLGGGAGYRVSESVTLKASYLNRWKVQAGAEDEISHIIGLTVVLRP